MKIETLKISCPYCLVGHADVPAIIRGESVEVNQIRDPRPCVMCKQYIVLKPKVTIVGITLEQAGKEGRYVA